MMCDMAKSRKPKVAKVAEPPKPRVRKGVSLNVWLPEDLMADFHALCEEEGRTLTEQVKRALKEQLARHQRRKPPATEAE